MSDMWCMRGVSEEAKRAAKAGAAGQGIRLGRWMEMAIMAHASWAGSLGAVGDNPIPKNGSFVGYSSEVEVEGPVSAEVVAAVESVPGVERRRAKTCPTCRSPLYQTGEGRWENEDHTAHVCGDAAFQ